jgi:hypothetical protein
MSALKGQGGKFSLFKASPFGAPASLSPVSDDESDEDFFSRSEHTYAILAAEKEEQKKRKAERECDVDIEGSLTTLPSGKKAKVADHEEDEGRIAPSAEILGPSRASPESSSVGFRDEYTAYDEIDDAEPDVNLSPKGKKASLPEIIDLEDAAWTEMDQSASEAYTGSKISTSSQEQTDPAPVLATAKAHEEDLSLSAEDVKNTSDQPNFTRKQPPNESTSNHESRAVVLILITSEIPETSALKVQRRLYQRLKEARLEWCDRQGFDKQKANDIVLTWRGKQVYDSTSCQGLGIQVDAAGEIIHDGDMDAIDDTNSQIHMEAMTRQMLKERKEVKSRRPTRETEASNDEPGSKAPAERRLRLVLKSKEHEDVKLVVKEVSKILDRDTSSW